MRDEKNRMHRIVRWSKMEIVSSQESRDIREETAGEKAFLPHVRSWGAREKKGMGRQGRKTEVVKVRSWLEVGSWAEERRENERMRELRVFRQLGKPSRDRSREDFFLGNMLSFPHLTTHLFSFSCTDFLSLSLLPSLRRVLCLTTSRDQIFHEQIKGCGISKNSECQIQP